MIEPQPVIDAAEIRKYTGETPKTISHNIRNGIYGRWLARATNTKGNKVGKLVVIRADFIERWNKRLQPAKNIGLEIPQKKSISIGKI